MTTVEQRPCDVRPGRSDLNRLLEELGPLFGDRLQTAPAVCLQHGQGEDHYPPSPPDAVCFPRSNEEVATLLAACNRLRVPVIPFGAGSSVEGHLLALNGGVSVDLSLMDRVLEVHPEDQDCRVQAGVTREQLNHELRHSGLFFPVDPGANATIGGMAATRASGTNAVRYGTMRENVMGLTVVTASGDIIRTGGRARKSAAGYDLTRLLVGSEGTLGVITEIQLRLHPQPECIRAAVCGFPTLTAAAETVIEAIQWGIPMARIELLNSLQMEACIRYSELAEFEPQPTLFLEFHGSESAVAEQVARMAEIVADHGGGNFRHADDQEARNRLWKARHSAYYAALALRPGWRAVTTDVCVPVSRLAEAIALAERSAEEMGLLCPVVGHVGDGNFHTLVLHDPEDPEARKKADRFASLLVEQALALGGTCTGEHGIGVGKKKYLIAEHGPGAVELMRTIKRALDPNLILNPGKILDL